MLLDFIYKNNKISMITLPASKFSKTELKNGDIVSFIQDHNAVNMKIFIQRWTQ